MNKHKEKEAEGFGCYYHALNGNSTRCKCDARFHVASSKTKDIGFAVSVCKQHKNELVEEYGRQNLTIETQEHPSEEW